MGVTTTMERKHQAPIEMKTRHMLLLMDMLKMPLFSPTLLKHTTQTSMVSLLYFHPKLLIFIDTFLASGTICDEHRNDILPDTPPPPHPSDHGLNDWTPSNNHVEFKVTDFLYHRNQMSGGDVDFIFHLWAASLATYNDIPPFENHTKMYETIDSTPIGDVHGESFTLEYDGVHPDNDIPLWMTMEYNA